MIKCVLLMLLMSNICYSQGVVRVYLEKPNTSFYAQTIIAFSDSTSDEVDQCCDAVSLGGFISTSIGNLNYVINSFGPLNQDKIIPLNTTTSPDTGLFTIGIDDRNGEYFPVWLYDSLTNTFHNLDNPYNCQAPLLDRFSLIFEAPLMIEVVNGCNLGYVVINNDEPSSPYHLQSEEFVGFYSNGTDTIFNLPNGNYTLSLPFEEFSEIVSFSIQNTIIDATLNVPLTTLYLGDSCIIPVLTVNSLWPSVEWDFGDGNLLFNDMNPVHCYSQSGTYILSVTISEGFCEKSFETEIQVKEPLSLGFIDYKDIPKYKPSNFYYAIDGRLVKRQ